MIHLRYLFEGRPQLSWPEAGMSPLITKVSQVALVHMLGVPAFVWHNAKLESVLLGGWKLGDWWMEVGGLVDGSWGILVCKNSKLSDLEKLCKRDNTLKEISTDSRTI